MLVWNKSDQAIVTEEMMKQLVAIYNLAHWPTGVEANVTDDRSEDTVQPIVVEPVR